MAAWPVLNLQHEVKVNRLPDGLALACIWLASLNRPFDPSILPEGIEQTPPWVIQKPPGGGKRAKRGH